MRRSVVVAAVLVVALGLAGPAMACSGLIGPRGAVDLGRTTTLAAYHDGVEHYVTAFTYSGAGGRFGSIVPLPDVPTSVERGGDWTLQRLVREVRPPAATARAAALQSADGGESASVEVVYQTRVDALDITVLKGGAFGVGEWASDNGFVLPPDAPEVLEFYASRSPVFMAAIFDAEAAEERGQQVGDGTPIHVTIPTANPWIPLRILALGKPADESVSADLFLLTERRPVLLPVRAAGLTLQRRELASQSLLDDLRSDAGMEWIPESMWLTHMTLDGPAGPLRFDLAADVHGSSPSWRAAGLTRPAPKPTPPPVVVASEPPPVATPSAGPPTVPTPAPSLLAAPVSTSGRGPALPAVAALLLLTPGTWMILRLVRRR